MSPFGLRTQLVVQPFTAFWISHPPSLLFSVFLFPSSMTHFVVLFPCRSVLTPGPPLAADCAVRISACPNLSSAQGRRGLAAEYGRRPGRRMVTCRSDGACAGLQHRRLPLRTHASDKRRVFAVSAAGREAACACSQCARAGLRRQSAPHADRQDQAALDPEVSFAPLPNTNRQAYQKKHTPVVSRTVLSGFCL